MATFTWRISHACLLSMLVWILSGYPCEPDCHWWTNPPLLILDLPIAVFWLPFQRVFVIDWWFNSSWESGFSTAFYLHMRSGVIAYLAFFYLGDLVKLIWNRNDEGNTEISSRQLALIRLGRWILGGTTISAAIWCLQLQPVAKSASYRLAAEVAHALDLPIAVLSQLLPVPLRGLDLWFGPPVDPESLYGLLFPHLLLGTLVYSVFFFLASLLLRKSLPRREEQLVVGPSRLNRLVVRGAKRMEGLLVSHHRQLATIWWRVALAIGLSGTVWLCGDLLPGSLPHNFLLFCLNALDFPVTLIWRAFSTDSAYTEFSQTGDETSFYGYLLLGSGAYLAYFYAFFLVGELGKRWIPKLDEKIQNGRFSGYAELFHLFLSAYLLAGATWYLNTLPIYLWPLELLTLIIRFFALPLAVLGLLLPPELRAIDLWFLDPWDRGTSADNLLFHMLTATTTYFLLLCCFQEYRHFRKKRAALSDR